MSPLNPSLYQALLSKFGKVYISNAGTAASYSQINDWFSTNLLKPEKPKITVEGWGEVYNVCCSKCGDKRNRLYISHVWGVYNELAGKKFYPIKCHNEACSWRELADELYADGHVFSKLITPVVEIGVEARKMELPCPEEYLVPVNLLEAKHPVVEYLISRGFTDLDLLSEEYKFCYCETSLWKKVIKDSNGCEHLVTPAGRLIIPNIQGGIWSGWQARYIGELPKDPNTNKPLIQKYLNAPGYSFGSSLYRLDSAVAFSGGEFCIVNEGALSAIACGFAGVCTFGMFPKPMQEELLARHFSNGKIIFLVEYEAKLNKRIYQCVTRLNSRVAGGAVAIDLPEGLDAANIGSEQLFELMSPYLGENI